jgi:hypothetical protein
VHEVHRPIGAVVRQLLPRCPHCDPGQFCSDDTDPNAKRPNKPRRTCYYCNRQHEKCQTWTDFQEAFSKQIEEALWDFRFEFWEHLGEGRYQLLLPDTRSVDLVHLGKSALRFIVVPAEFSAFPSGFGGLVQDVPVQIPTVAEHGPLVPSSHGECQSSPRRAGFLSSSGICCA